VPGPLQARKNVENQSRNESWRPGLDRPDLAKSVTYAVKPPCPASLKLLGFSAQCQTPPGWPDIQDMAMTKPPASLPSVQSSPCSIGGQTPRLSPCASRRTARRESSSPDLASGPSPIQMARL